MCGWVVLVCGCVVGECAGNSTNLACATVMNEVALLRRTGTGEEGCAAGVPGVPGVDSPGVPGGVPRESFIMTAGLPGRVRLEMETPCAFTISSSMSSSRDPVLSYPSPDVPCAPPESSFLRLSRSFIICEKEYYEGKEHYEGKNITRMV